MSEEAAYVLTAPVLVVGCLWLGAWIFLRVMQLRSDNLWRARIERREEERHAWRLKEEEFFAQQRASKVPGTEAGNERR